MLRKIESWISAYCFGVLEVFFAALERLHPIVSIGVPLLFTICANWFLPRWMGNAVIMLVWLPAAIALAVFIWSCSDNNRPRHDS